MSENIRRVGRELKYKGAILDVYTDHMEFENGNKAEWDFIKHKGRRLLWQWTRMAD